MQDKRLTGKFEKPQTYTGSRPPMVEDEINTVIRQFSSKRHLPECMPKNFSDVAGWWISKIEPPKETEHPQSMSTADGEGIRWVCPYHNRVLYTLRKFINSSNKDCQYILAAREDGIFWRGDDISFFIGVVAETVRMRKIGVKNYREECLDRMKNSFLKRLPAQERDGEAEAERKAIQEG